MLTRFKVMSLDSQCKLYNFALVLNLLGMVLTDMWLPMVVGAFVTTYLSVESWIRLRYVEPMERELDELKRQVKAMSERT
uniref:hypothetical protein n=1 Tax=Thaumasiovibrio occultus TaxID=1891184 RepID=UPI000B35AA62|nr:hypothetical protein [Thaumasiovibrio occultus]